MLDIMTNAPRPLQVGEKTYQVGALKLTELGQLQRWIRTHSACPSEVLRATIDMIPEAERSRAVAEARAADYDWPPAPGTVMGNTILFRDPAGQMEFLRIFFCKFQSVSTAELAEIAAGLSEEDFGVLIAIAFGDDDLDPTEARAAARTRLAALAAQQEADARALDAMATAMLGASSLPTSGETAKESSPPTSESSPSPSS